MTERQYTILLKRDPEMGVYTETVPALPGVCPKEIPSKKPLPSPVKRSACTWRECSPMGSQFLWKLRTLKRSSSAFPSLHELCREESDGFPMGSSHIEATKSGWRKAPPGR